MGSPVFREMCFDARTGSHDRAGSGTHLALAVRPVLPLAHLDSGGTLKSWGQFHGSIPGSHLPLSTLHPCPHGHRRMTRGQSGSLTLPCIGLPPTTHLRLSTAHQDQTPAPAQENPYREVGHSRFEGLSTRFAVAGVGSSYCVAGFRRLLPEERRVALAGFPRGAKDKV